MKTTPIQRRGDPFIAKVFQYLPDCGCQWPFCEGLLARAQWFYLLGTCTVIHRTAENVHTVGLSIRDPVANASDHHHGIDFLRDGTGLTVADQGLKWHACQVALKSSDDYCSPRF